MLMLLISEHLHGCQSAANYRARHGEEPGRIQNRSPLGVSPADSTEEFLDTIDLHRELQLTEVQERVSSAS